MFVVEDGGELRAKKEYETGDIAPRQNCDDGPHRAVDLIVVKIVERPGEDVLSCFPQKPADNCAWQGISEGDFRLRHKAIDDYEERRSDQETADGKDALP